MKKALILVGAIAAFSFSQASELWWTVANPQSVGAWDEAKLFVSENGYNYGSTHDALDTVSAADMADLGFVMTDLQGYGSSAYSFYVELYNSETLVGKSYVKLDAPQQGATPYNTLSSANAIYDGNLMNPTASAYTFSSFTTSDVIPEPSSGLMMLLGMIALGLKRKKV